MPPIIVEPLITLAGMSPPRKQAFVYLELLSATGTWVKTKFRVDTGANLSLFGWEQFKSTDENLLLTQVSNRKLFDMNLADGTLIKTEGFTAQYRARFESEPRWIFSWDALFVRSGNADAAPLLGIGGTILNDVHITFAGWTRQHPTAFSGTVSFDIQIPPNVELPAIDVG